MKKATKRANFALKMEECDCNMGMDDDRKVLFCLTKDNQMIDYAEE